MSVGTALLALSPHFSSFWAAAARSAALALSEPTFPTSTSISWSCPAAMSSGAVFDTYGATQLPMPLVPGGAFGAAAVGSMRQIAASTAFDSSGSFAESLHACNASTTFG